MAVRSVPRKQIVFGSIQNLGPRQPNQYEITFAHATAQEQRVVRKMCPPPSTVMSISIKQYSICARSVGPFGPPEEEKRDQNTCSSSS